MKPSEIKKAIIELAQIAYGIQAQCEKGTPDIKQLGEDASTLATELLRVQALIDDKGFELTLKRDIDGAVTVTNSETEQIITITRSRDRPDTLVDDGKNYVIDASTVIGEWTNGE